MVATVSRSLSLPRHPRLLQRQQTQQHVSQSRQFPGQQALIINCTVLLLPALLSHIQNDDAHAPKVFTCFILNVAVSQWVQVGRVGQSSSFE